MVLTYSEQQIKKAILKLKEEAGSHSPSIQTLLEQFPEIRIKIDACFLSNPYATDIFMDYLNEDLIHTGHLREVLEYYPTQSGILAKDIGKFLKVDPDTLFIGNGATEIIQSVLHRFCRGKVLLPIPTFSPYYEFIRGGSEVIYHKLEKSEDYLYNVDRLVDDIRKYRPDTFILINPNNPNGGYLIEKSVRRLLEEARYVNQFILDESFIHFAYESDDYKPIAYDSYVEEFPNLVVIKSMSKDFGVAGIRAGYAFMSPRKVKELMSTGFLWNVSGLAEYFFKLFINDEFQRKYENERIRFINETREFFSNLKSCSFFKTYPSKANFALAELKEGLLADDIALKLLVNDGIYIRSCKDKLGLSGEFIRIASRRKEENEEMIRVLNHMDTNI